MANGEQRSRSWFGRGCLLSLLGFFLMPFISLFLLSFVVKSLGSSEPQTRLQEELIQGPREAKNKLVLIEDSGVMLRREGGLSSASGVSARLLELIRAARKDDAVRGILLRLNTPGGGLTDADLIHHELERLRSAGKSILFLMDDLCASGGYYASLAADEVWALPTTITGSIGVIIQGYNFSGLLERVGIEDSSISSGPNKALLSGSRPRNPEQEALVRAIINEFQARFVSLLIEARGLSEEEARARADGRIYSAQQALEASLIDRIGYPEDALERALELARGAKSDRAARAATQAASSSAEVAEGGAGSPGAAEETEPTTDAAPAVRPSTGEGEAYQVIRYRIRRSFLESLSEALWSGAPLAVLRGEFAQLRAELRAPALSSPR